MVWVNFMPWRQRQQRQRLRHFCGLQLAPFLGLVLALSLLQGRDYGEREQQRSQHAIWQEATALLQQRLTEVEQEQRLRDEAQAKWRSLQARREQRLRQLAALTALGASLPETLWLTRLAWQAGRLTLQGHALAPEAAENWRQTLTSHYRVGSLQQNAPTAAIYDFTLNVAEIHE